jgi:pyruvate carboxylase
VQLSEGQMFYIKYIGTGLLDTHNGTRDVFFELNGESRVVPIKDQSARMYNVAMTLWCV